MDLIKVEFILICLVALYRVSYGEDCNNDLSGKSSAVKLFHDLFCSYDKSVRPVINHSTQIIVRGFIYIFRVHMEEELDNLRMNVHMYLSWKDEFLVWDPSKYDNIDFVFADSEKVWLPDIVSYAMGDNNHLSFNLPDAKVKISNTGFVKYVQIVVLSAQCSANIAMWPFDSHNCSFILGSPIYTNKYVNYTFSKDGEYDLDDYVQDREWEVIDIQHKRIHYFYPSGNTSIKEYLLQYNVNIRRYSSMYFSSIIIPAVVLSLMRTFTFLMGREFTLRLGLLCLFFISELMYLQYLDMKIPNNGQHGVLIILLYRNSLILTAVAIVICVITNEIYKRGTEDLPRNAPEWIKSISTFLLSKRAITMLTNFNNQGAELLIERTVEEETPNSQRDENALFWKTLSILLDRIFFIITLLISMINFWFLIP